MPANNIEPRAEVTHGMCAECLVANFPDQYEQVNVAVNGPADLNLQVEDVDLGFWPSLMLYLIVGVLLFMSALIVWRLACAEM